MNRLIVLNRFFYPDHSATSQILTDLRLHFAASGVDVHVITSQQLYDDPSRQLPAKATTAQMRTFRAAARETRLAPPERLR
jgi:colanic acid biosynthesis glycosyl transferase WcaI